MSKLSYRFTFLDIEEMGGSDTQGRAGRVRSASPSRCWASIARPDLTDHEVAKQHLRRLQGGHIANSDPAEAPAQSRSRGSVGHPTLCAKPCIQFARGLGCRKGRACGNCHWPHHRVQPDKRQREFSRTLGNEEFFGLLSVLAREKALQDGLEDVGFLLAAPGRRISKLTCCQPDVSLFHPGAGGAGRADTARSADEAESSAALQPAEGAAVCRCSGLVNVF